MVLIKLKSLILRIQRMFLRHERWISAPHPSEVQDPVFIVGAPRTGSTLLFQLMLNQFNMGYYSNLMALLPMFASRIGCLFKRKLLGFTGIKHSNYGVIGGLHSPNEGGKINAFWFEVVPDEVHVKKVRRGMGHLSSCLDAPILIKSLGNSLRIENILKVFPGARFIHIKRDPLFTAQSILKGRIDVNGDINSWLGMKPPGTNQVRAARDPYYQVVWQILSVDNRIISDFKKFHAEYYSLNYQDLCSDPYGVMNELADRFGLSPKNADPMTDDLQISEAVHLPDTEWKKLQEALHQVQNSKLEYD